MSKQKKLSKSVAGRLELISRLMNVPEDWDEDGNPIGEITSLLTPEEALRLLNFKEEEYVKAKEE